MSGGQGWFQNFRRRFGRQRADFLPMTTAIATPQPEIVEGSFRPTKAPYPFWTDGQADPSTCTMQPHKFVEIRMGDALMFPRNPDERLVICKRCFVPRCGHTNDVDPCTLARHHLTDHVLVSGASYAVGSAPGDLAEK